jgi:hypothetical protein
MGNIKHAGKRGVQAGPSGIKVGRPKYLQDAVEKRREQYNTAAEYVANRDKQIDRQAKMLSVRAGVPYDEARARIEAQWADMERANDTYREVRALALGYNEDAIIQKANEQLAARNATTDPLAVLLGTSAGLNRKQRRKGQR